MSTFVTSERQTYGLEFSESQQQLGNSGNKILFPQLFFDINFQLKNPQWSTCDSLHKYPFNRPGSKHDIASTWLKYSHWVPVKVKKPSLALKGRSTETMEPIKIVRSYEFVNN